MRTLESIFQDRTCYKFLDKLVNEKTLHKIYDLMKLGPTSANSCPIRIIFVQTSEAKEKLLNCVMEGNVEKIKALSI
jgi:nitroreductase